MRRGSAQRVELIDHIVTSGHLRTLSDGYALGVARRADDILPVRDQVVDGRSEDEIEESVAAWLDELRVATPVKVSVSAADELKAARREGDV